MTGTRDDSLVDRTARSIADGVLLDEHNVEEADPKARVMLEQLRRVSRIADAYRQLGRAPEEPKEGAQFKWGQLMVYECIGEGSFARVYRAYDPILCRDVALKLVKLDERSQLESGRFVEEARQLARVRHPNVLTVYGADVHEGQPGLWCEFLKGESLAQWVERRGPMGQDEASVIGMHLCRALCAVHQAGLVHGDVKPANIFREEGGRIVLLDFGAVRGLRDPGTLEVGLSVGTPATMAPELLEGEVASVGSDVYSVGAVLFWLVCRAYPVGGETLAQLLDHHRDGKINNLRRLRPNLSRSYIDIVNKTVSRDVRDRFADPGQLEDALCRGIRRDVGRVRWRPWILAAVAAIAVVALLFLFQTKTHNQAPLEARGDLILNRDGAERSLQHGDLVRPGDQLHMRWNSAETSYVYIFNQDESGQFYVLFPVDGLSTQNPIAAGQDVRLPGTMDGERMDWQVTSIGGRESFLVVAARQPIDQLQALVLQQPNANSSRAVEYGQPVAQSNLRGIGGLSRANESVTDGPLSSVRDLIDAIRGQGRDVVVQEFVLNSEPF